MCACSNGQAEIESETNMSEADFKAQASVTALERPMMSPPTSPE